MHNNQESYLYELPFFAKSSLNWFFRLVFITAIISSAFFVYLLISLGMTEDLGILGAAITLFFILLGVGFTYVLVYHDIAGKGHIEITEEYLEFTDLYKCRRFLWSEIHSVGTYNMKGNTILGLILKRNLHLQRTLWRRMNSTLGDPYDIRLSLTMFSSIDADKLLFTIQSHLNPL